ncbi:helix-turn-helix transcriptional regulator [Bradyrhizobium sp. Pear77]|uniref:AraC family transcriptional regulator n=1 Tax=Bradyrhizobium TaxID=374 RepID=UPI002898028D|nr:AraC family transcriptional regulator [Bradyrhizobium altum]MCC8954193.1 helix-turn-helix transcriptional regulator [Bradyrhizobium altum]MCC8963869.1 helix-turn-helix transcriptional regulator [Bradyrhizobium oropedii]
MTDQGAYGQRLADVFQLERAPSFVTRSLQKSTIAVTEIKCGITNHGLTAPIPREEAFLITLQLRDCPRHDLFIDDRQVPSGHLQAGSVCIYDLRSSPVANSISPFHSLHFYVPRAALNAIADMEDSGRVDEFDNKPGLGTRDATLGGLGEALLPAFRRPEEADQLFVDHLTIAAMGHAIKTYGVAPRQASSVVTALTPMQVRRAEELLSSRLDGELFVSDLASECGLPTAAFLRAFRAATGVSPHRWLMQYRVEHAKSLLKRAPVSLSEVARLCGFATDDHMARSFRRVTGQHPKNWRKG